MLNTKSLSSFVVCSDKGAETLKRIAKVLGSTNKQQTDTFSNQNSEVLESDPIDGGSAEITVDVNKDEELMKRTRDQYTDTLDALNTTGDDKTDDNNSSSFSLNPLKNEDMLIRELKVRLCVCFFFFFFFFFQN